MSETYDHTISGLLRKRADLFNEAILIRERLAEIKNDIEALDRTLGALGYKGDLDAAMPRQKRQVIFGQGELTRAIMAELRDADGPMTSREVAQSIVALQGHDARDRKYVTDLTRRVSKALRKQRDDGRVRSSTDAHGNIVWSRRIVPGASVSRSQE
jgi:hypothetical protein